MIVDRVRFARVKEENIRLLFNTYIYVLFVMFVLKSFDKYTKRNL